MGLLIWTKSRSIQTVYGLPNQQQLQLKIAITRGAHGPSFGPTWPVTGPESTRRFNDPAGWFTNQ